MSNSSGFSVRFTQAAQQEYDVLFAANGFESRATAVSELLAPRSRKHIALGFDHNKVLSYSSNLAWFKSNGFDVRSNLSSAAFTEEFRRQMLDVTSEQCPPEFAGPRIAIDISCFDRQRLAAVIDCLRTNDRKLIVDFYYSVGAFIAPSDLVVRNEVAGPIHRCFAGRFSEPGLPLALVAGLGYESGKVVGAAEYLQASRVLAFVPESPVVQYEPEVLAANALLLDDVSEQDVFRYRVDDPQKLVATLDSVVRGLLRTHNVVMLPGGPKIFPLSCLLLHSLHLETSVWRVSTGSAIIPRDVCPSGYIVCLSAVFG